MSQATGVAADAGAPVETATAQSKIEPGKSGVMAGTMPPTDLRREQDREADRADRGLARDERAAARVMATKNAGTRSGDTEGDDGGEVGRAVQNGHEPVVTASGMTTAATQRTSVAVSHLLTRTLVRETGLEIVQASVPLSRSARSRLIVAKMAARTMNWVPIAKSRLSIGRTERTLAGPSPGSAGRDRAAHSDDPGVGGARGRRRSS